MRAGATAADFAEQFAAVLPFQVLHYPIPQLMRTVDGVAWTAWPPPMKSSLASWITGTRELGSAGNQIYVHVPFCPFYCHFCPLYKTQEGQHRNAETVERFVAAVIKEITAYGGLDLPEDSFRTVYFGGGSPTQLSPQQLGRILGALRQSFRIQPDAEVTLEGVATRLADPHYLQAAIEQGFNRISFGVQTLDPEIRLKIGRGEHLEDYTRLLDTLADLGQPVPFNADLMIGLPGQTVEGHMADLAEVIGWGVTSLDVYAYWMVPGTRLFTNVTEGRRHAPRYGSELLELRRRGKELLLASGFHQASGEAYVRAEEDAFIQTTFGAGGNGINTALAFGPSAIGLVNGSLYQNGADLSAYLAFVEGGRAPVGSYQQITGRVAQRRATLFGMQRLVIPKPVVSRRTDRQLRLWVERGLLDDRGTEYIVTQEGSLWYNQMQLGLLPLGEQVRLAGLMGTSEQQRQALANSRDDDLGLASQFKAQVRGRSKVVGNVRFAGYRGLLELKRLPFLPDDAMDFRGRIRR